MPIREARGPVVTLSDEEISELVEFLRALTDPRAVHLREDVPMRVPSGWPLAE
jgi:hypothetical protein